MKIYTNGRIGATGLGVTQNKEGTVVYTVETHNQYTNPDGRKYKEHPMPEKRYYLANDHPYSGVAGRAQFYQDILNLMNRSDFEL